MATVDSANMDELSKQAATEASVAQWSSVLSAYGTPILVDSWQVRECASWTAARPGHKMIEAQQRG